MSLTVRSNHMYELVDADAAHVSDLVEKLRREDDETEALLGIDAHEKLSMIYDLSKYRKSWLVDGKLSAMGGVMETPRSGVGEMWLSMTRGAKQHVSPLYRAVGAQLAEIQPTRDLVTTIVRADEDRWRFARHCGFRLQHPCRYRDVMAMEMPRVLPQHPVPVMGASHRPFIVYGLPRSRTAWMANFLTYGGWQCGHDEATYMREVADIGRYFQRPRIGAVEPGGAGPGWSIVSAIVPDIRMAVVRRPVADVVESTRRLSRDVIKWDVERLTRVFTYMARMLDQIAKVPGTLVLDYDDLETEAGCQALFEHCLPFRFDRSWWQSVAQQNIQVDMAELFRYRTGHRSRIDGFKRACWSEMRRLVSVGGPRNG